MEKPNHNCFDEFYSVYVEFLLIYHRGYWPLVSTKWDGSGLAG